MSVYPDPVISRRSFLGGGLALLPAMYLRRRRPAAKKPATTYTATGLKPNTAYTVKVRAYDARGVRGPWSTPLLVHTKP